MIKKYPFIKQSNSVDCGIASMAMIFEYYKTTISQYKLKKDAKVTSDGTTAYNIIKAFIKNGFDAKGYSAKREQLYKIKLPCIVHTTIDKTYLHYQVLYEIKERYVIVGDPLIGIKKIPIKKFDEIYNDIVITITPVIITEKKRENYFLKEIIKKIKKEIFILIILTTISTSLNLANSYYFMYMINSKEIFTIFMLFFNFGIIKLIIDYLKNNLVINLKKKIDEKIKTDSFNKIIELPYIYYSTTNAGDIISKMTDLDIVKNFVINFTVFTFYELPLMIGCLIIISAISPEISLLIMLFTCLYLIIAYLYKNKNIKNTNNVIVDRSILNSFIEQKISSYETTKSFALENKIINEYKGLLSYNNQNIKQFDKSLNFQFLIFEFITHNLNMIVVLFGFILISKNQLELPLLITLISLINMYLNPIFKFGDMIENFEETKTIILRISEIKEEQIGSYIGNKINTFEANNLSYSYDGVNNVFENLNFTIKEGEKVIITGLNGTGKSTLIKIIVKYLDDFEGELKINSINIEDYDYKNYNQKISYVNNKIQLEPTTISQNIGKINEDYFEMLDLKKEDLEKQIKNNDFNISSGEKQKIILLKAINKEFDLLIIDEALNSVENEEKILRNIFSLFKSKTIIYVSHSKNLNIKFDKKIQL